MSTLDFELEIGPGADDETYPVVARAPGGEASAQLRLPVPLAELDRQLAVIRGAVLASSAVTRRLPTGDEHPVRELGRRLFEALFADDVRGLYVASSQRARERGATLRLVLRVRPPELARLPWEFLFDPGQQDYLGLSLPLVRYPDVLAPRQPLHVEPPLRILGMSARPGDQHPLSMDREQRRLRGALAELQRKALVELGWVAGQTYGELEAAMDRGPWHVLHFVGHGGYDRAVEEGTLVFTDEQGCTDRVGAEDLSRLLADHHTLRLIVLNACDTARGGSADAFSGTAAALMRRGIPAVVAMQFEISDGAAIRFAQTFYQNVAKRLPVDTAVMRARRALRLAKKDTLEWGTPVLYLRAADARIFDAASPRPRRARARRELADPPHRPRPVIRHPAVVRTVRHDGAVNAVVFSSDGRRLATAGDDRTARIWDVTSGAQLVRLVHDTVVRAVAFSRNGRLVTATGERTARVWSAGGAGRLATVEHDFLWGVALSPDGRRLATTSHDRTARIWDVGSGAHLLTLTHDNAVRGVVFSADGRRLATASGTGTVRLWDVTDAALLATVTQDDAVRAVALSPHGQWLATAGGDGIARVWDAASAVLVTEVTHDDSVTGAAFSPCGRRLATASRDRTARIWALDEEGDYE
ncbi:MAG: CHAT domain-containing WD40 repeat protein [Pseudonocardiaceae bacterium]